MTAKPNNGVSCAARPLRHSPAPRGDPSATLCGWHCVRGQGGRGVRVHVWTQQLVLVPLVTAEIKARTHRRLGRHNCFVVM